MDYKTMLAWAERLKARCLREGKSEQDTRDRIYNAALVMFSTDDTITPGGQAQGGKDNQGRYAWTGKRGRADGIRAPGRVTRANGLQ